MKTKRENITIKDTQLLQDVIEMKVDQNITIIEIERFGSTILIKTKELDLITISHRRYQKIGTEDVVFCTGVQMIITLEDFEKINKKNKRTKRLKHILSKV